MVLIISRISIFINKLKTHYMANKTNKCAKCKVEGQVCPKSTAKKNATERKAVSGEKSKTCFPCIINLNLIEYSFDIQSEHTKEAGVLAIALLKEMATLKQASEERQMRFALARGCSNNRMKELWITGSFWLGAFAAIFYMLSNLAISDLHLFSLLAVLISMPNLFTLVSACILRWTKSLKQKNFMELMLLGLRLNFKGMKFLSETKK
jgi:hypothetical protein